MKQQWCPTWPEWDQEVRKPCLEVKNQLFREQTKSIMLHDWDHCLLPSQRRHEHKSSIAKKHYTQSWTTFGSSEPHALMNHFRKRTATKAVRHVELSSCHTKDSHNAHRNASPKSLGLCWWIDLELWGPNASTKMSLNRPPCIFERTFSKVWRLQLEILGAKKSV